MSKKILNQADAEIADAEIMDWVYDTIETMFPEVEGLVIDSTDIRDILEKAFSKKEEEVLGEVIMKLDVFLKDYSIDRPIPPSIFRKFQDDLYSLTKQNK